MSDIFTRFINILLRCFLAVIIAAAVLMIFASLYGSSIAGTCVFISVMTASLLCSYKIINSDIDHNKKVILLMVLGVILRILWILNTDNIPNSDFNTMYDSAQKFINGDTDVFKGTSYAARFPHITITILYMALMRWIFPQFNLEAMKIVNLVSGLSVSYIIYLMCIEIFKDKKEALYSLGICSIFPAFITYTPVFCSENIAMPFYVISVLLFLKSMNKKEGSIGLILSSILLAAGNLFRMIADVILIAYILYILFYYKESILKKIRNILFVILPYILIIVCVSTFLQRAEITENPLWRGCEPKITSVLRGTNLSSLGMWNEEDAEVAEECMGNYDKIEEKSRDIIRERLTTTPVPKLLLFYIGKLASQWCIGDFSGTLWTQKDIDDSRILFKVGIFGSLPFQIIYLEMLLMIFYGLLNKNRKKSYVQLNLFYIIFLGYIGAYLITENQCRYGYIASWIFIIMTVDGMKTYADNHLL